MSDLADKLTPLLTVPFSEMHCGQLAYRVLHDLLELDVEEHDLWIDDEAPDLERRVDEYLARQGERWERIGSGAEAATQIGDVIWSEGTEDYGRNHLSVLVLLRPVPTVISTSSRTGAPYLVRASVVSGVRGVFRFVG